MARIRALKIGQKMQDLPEALWHESFRFYVKEDPDRKGGPNLRMIRLDPEQPSLTVTGFIYNKFVHPYEDRFITPREAARLQGFPDDLEFKGSLTSVQQQVGDAVPIPLGRAVFTSIQTFVQKMMPEKSCLPAISLFSGAGGLDIAAHQSSATHPVRIQTLACVEVEADRCATLNGYFKDDVQIVCQNIAELNVDDLLHSVQRSKEEIALVYGGPPCQSFSQAGKQKGAYDPRGELIFEFLRVVRTIKPLFFFFENVSNLKAIAGGTLFDHILQQIDTMGYQVDHSILNAAHFGTPQKRQRLIVLGTHRSVGKRVHLPTPTHAEHADLFGIQPFNTVGKAFAGLPATE